MCVFDMPHDKDMAYQTHNMVHWYRTLVLVLEGVVDAVSIVHAVFKKINLHAVAIYGNSLKLVSCCFVESLIIVIPIPI